MSSLTDVKGALSSMPEAIRDHVEYCKSCKNHFGLITTEKALKVLKEVVSLREYRNYIKNENDSLKLLDSHFAQLKDNLYEKVMELSKSVKDLSIEDFHRCNYIAEHSVVPIYI